MFGKWGAMRTLLDSLATLAPYPQFEFGTGKIPSWASIAAPPPKEPPTDPRLVRANAGDVYKAP